MPKESKTMVEVLWLSCFEWVYKILEGNVKTQQSVIIKKADYKNL
jgi:hypothetical protein